MAQAQVWMQEQLMAHGQIFQVQNEQDYNFQNTMDTFLSTLRNLEPRNPWMTKARVINICDQF